MWCVMKPSLSPQTLQTALVIVGGMLVAFGETPIAALIPPAWLPLAQVFQHGLALFGAVLVGKEGFQRRTDFAPHELPLGLRKTDPPQ